MALVPVGVALAFGVLLFPRHAAPDSVPVPTPDLRELARAAAADHTLAEEARRTPLPSAVRALGSAMREYHIEEVESSEQQPLALALRAVEKARPDAFAEGEDALLRLRAVQLEAFLADLRVFEATGEESEDLVAIAGSFIRGMRYEGWAHDHTLDAGDGARRAMFKEMWNGLAGVSDRPAFRPPLDEERALYALYLSEPHPARAMRDALTAARRAAQDAASCEALAFQEQHAIEAWRIDRIDRLAAIDPTYPAAYARGVAHLRHGDFAGAAADLSSWLQAHPDGPLALRARASLRAAAEGLRVQ